MSSKSAISLLDSREGSKLNALTSSSPSKDEDSFCKTAMSRRKDIVSCIDVTIVDCSAHRALPSSYSKTLPALRAGAAFTHAAGLGGKRFIDLREPHACVSALVQQHGSEGAPSGIEHRLSLSGLGESGGIHVADEDSTVGLDQAGAQFVKGIFSPIGDFGLNCSEPLRFPGALRARQGGLEVAVTTSGIDRRPTITERRKALQPQIYPDARDRPIEDRSDRRFMSPVRHPLRARDADIQIPSSAAVLTEITRAQFEVAQAIAVPERQPPAGEVDLAPSIANRSDFEGNPAPRAARTAALAPGQSYLSVLSAPPRVFFGDHLHRLNRQMQGALSARDSFEKRPEIESRQKPPFPLEHFHRQFVAVIEDRVDLARQGAQPRGVPALHPQAQDPDGGRSRAGHPYSISKCRSQNTCANSEKCGPWDADDTPRRSLSLAGLKAGVSRGEVG